MGLENQPCTCSTTFHFCLVFFQPDIVFSGPNSELLKLKKNHIQMLSQENFLQELLWEHFLVQALKRL